MGLTILVLVDFLLLWLSRLTMHFPHDYEIHLFLTFLLIFINLSFIFRRRPAPGVPGFNIPDGVRKTLAPIASVIDRHPVAPFLVLLVLGTLIRFHIIRHFPIDSNFGDMLPLIRSALARFLSGAYPYVDYQVPWTIPLYYFPLLWLSYLPAFLLRMDLRITGIVINAVIFFLFWQEAYSERRSQPADPVANLMIFLLGVFFFLNPYTIIFTPVGHTFPYWLYLALCLYLIQKERPLGAVFFLGLAFASWQPAVALIPFVFLYAFRNLPKKRFFQCGALLVVTTAALILPFFLISPKSFFFEPMHKVNDMAPTKIKATLGSIGFSATFFIHHAVRLLPYFQIGFLLALLLIAWRKLKDTYSLFIFLGWALFLYHLFAFYIPTDYFYYTMILIFSFAVLNRWRSYSAPGSVPAFSSGRLVGTSALIAGAVVLAYAVYSLFGAYGRGGRLEMNIGFYPAERGNPIKFHWSDGPRSVASFGASALDVLSKHDIPLAFKARPFVYPRCPPQVVTLRLNDKTIRKIRLPRGLHGYFIHLPVHRLVVGNNKLEFQFAYVGRPGRYFRSKDMRKLAVLFHFNRSQLKNLQNSSAPLWGNVN
jgi:hypothetical protein